MGFRTELLGSRTVTQTGQHSIEVRHVFRITNENPERAIFRSIPPLPVEAGSPLDSLILSFADDTGSITKVLPGDALAHTSDFLVLARAKTVLLRSIITDWYPSSTTDSIVTLVYRSGLLEGHNLREAQSVIWEFDGSAQIDTAELAEPFIDDAISGLVSVPGGMPVVSPTLMMNGIMNGSTVTREQITKIGTWNKQSFFTFPAGFVRYMGVSGKVITGTNVADTSSRSNVVLTFVAVIRHIQGSIVKPSIHFVAQRDDNGIPTGLFDRFKSPSDEFPFSSLFPADWDPGAFVR